MAWQQPPGYVSVFFTPQTIILFSFYREALHQEAMVLLLLVDIEVDMVLQEEDTVLHQEEDTVPLKALEVMVILLQGAINPVTSNLPLVAMETHLLVAMATPKAVLEVVVDTVHQGLTSRGLPYVQS